MQQQQERDYTQRLDAGLWLRLAGYLKPYRIHLLLSAAALVASALCDAAFPLLTREALDRFVEVSAVLRLGDYGGLSDGEFKFARRFESAAHILDEDILKSPPVKSL